MCPCFEETTMSQRLISIFDGGHYQYRQVYKCFLEYIAKGYNYQEDTYNILPSASIHILIYKNILKDRPQRGLVLSKLLIDHGTSPKIKNKKICKL